MQRICVWAITMSRTELGKRLRGEYEKHLIHHAFNEHRYMTVRKDEISNTISTVQKDYLVCECYEID